MRIIVTGAGGFLGRRLYEHLKGSQDCCDRRVTGLSRRELDLTDREAVERTLCGIWPDIVIHCAAISDIGACERQPELSHRINVELPRQLAGLCSRMGARLIFCSSDQVYFDNGVRVPHREEELLTPIPLYGRQKKQAEEAVLSVNPDSVCLRLSWMYDTMCFPGEHSQLLWNIKKAAEQGGTLSLPIYDFRSITDVRDVVGRIEKTFAIAPGIYNFGSENDLSAYELVYRAVSEHPRLKQAICSNREAFKEKARNLRMDMSRTEKAGILFPDGLTALREAFERMENERQII